jgi:uncharacterized membrane protein
MLGRSWADQLAMNAPLHLEYFSGWWALAIFAALAAPIVLLGVRSLNGLGPVRKWVALGMRLLVLLVLVLILGGARWQRQHKDVEVLFIRDLSDSTSYVTEHPAETLRKSLDQYMAKSLDAEEHKPGDRVGVIGFADNAIVESLPSQRLNLGSHAVQESGRGTNVASAIQLGLASLSNEAMRRMVLIWDGNQTTGDLAAAAATAAAQGVPIDVMPLHYNVPAAVMMERFVAPSWKREKDAFTLQVVLRNTADHEVTGQLSILHQGKPIDVDADRPGVQTALRVTLKPGRPTRVDVKVPPLEGGIHPFRAVFELDARPGQKDAPIVVTPSMDAFTIVQGKGKVLYVDNVEGEAGQILARALAEEGISLERIHPTEMPHDVMGLQNYDAVIMANVSAGAGGIDSQQDQMLASYVHDMGGGLLMIGGPETFGAGGWQGSQVEKVLPVDMDIPARRMIGRGALVLVMHACEMTDGSGNYWGKQCALKAVDALSGQDEIGVISYSWQGSQASWDFELATKGSGEKVKAAIQGMQHGDMPSFQDCMDLALNGRGSTKGLKDSQAQHKHVIVISDGDPTGPTPELLQKYRDFKVSISTVSVYPHGMGGPDSQPPAMAEMAKATKGRTYGPINNKPEQLPQIFIKEAQVVRRTLIYEEEAGIPLRLRPSLSDVVQGLGRDLPPVTGMVLTSVKKDPLIDMPIVAGKAANPLLAHWQTGLGKAAVFTSDAHTKWASRWVNSRDYSKFWAQVVRSVSRPPMSRDMDLQTTVEGDKIRVVAEAMDKEAHRLSFLNVAGQVIGPDMKVRDIRLAQVGPGRYETTIDAANAGAYAVRLSYTGPKGESGWQVAGAAVNSNPELRDLTSNDAAVEQVATRTGGRVLSAFDPVGASLFTRKGLKQTASPLPVWDYLTMTLLGLILVDVAVRRIAWDWKTLKTVAVQQLGLNTARKIEKSESVDALRRLREGGKEPAAKPTKAPAADVGEALPVASTKFEAKGPRVEGDLTKVVGGATSQPAPKKKPVPQQQPAGNAEDRTTSLLAAKRRAREQMDKKDEER